MAQLKQTCTVTNGSQTVAVIGANVAYRIKANSIFMVQGELVPYVIAADATFDGTNTVVKLAAAYQGAGSAMAGGVFATDFTVPDNLPLLSQGDVGTAAIWTNTMYKIQALMSEISPTSLAASIDDIHASLNGAQQAQEAATASAADALASENAAKTSETNARTSETNALSSASAAATSKTNAGTSEANAATSKTAAAGSAASAATSASAASSSQGSAATSATSAANSATAAAGSAGAASTSQGAASASQTAAKTSETNAKTSETNAKTSETNSKTSEMNAAVSATAAAGSATAAAGSAGAASTSASSAANSLTAVQGILTTLNALYLGQKSSDPTKDNNGAALAVGAEYFNTVTKQMRVYTSTGWQDVDATSETMAANATVSASQAAGSASAAAGSASAASASQTAAAGSATAASTSATNASNSASAAATSAGNASTSASNAKNSETNSKTSENNAAASAAQAAQTAENMGNPVSKHGDSMDGSLTIATTADATHAQLTVVGADGALGNEGKIRLHGTFATGTDVGQRLVASLRAGFNGGSWGKEYLDFWINNGAANDALSDANQQRVMRLVSGGRVLVGALTDDGSTQLQVAGSMKAANYYIQGQAAADSGIYGFSNANGPCIAAYGSGTTPAGALVFRTAAVERARMLANGRILIGTTSDDGVGTLQVNSTLTLSGARGASVSTGNFDGLSIESFNTGNTVKKPVALAPYGGNVLIGTLIDDGNNALQVHGTSITSGTAYFGASGRYASVWTDTNASYFVGTNHVLVGSSAVDGVLMLQAGSAERMRVTAAGRVLIGSQSDDGSAAALQVTGSIRAKATTGALIAANGGGTTQTSIMLKREGAPVDQKQWELFSGSDGSMGLRAVNDTYSSAAYAFNVTRGTGVGLSTMQMMANGGRVLVGPVTDDGASSLQVWGNGRFSGEVQSTSSNSFRIVSGNFGAFLRNDGNSVYLMQTASGDPYGSYNNFRPFYWSLATGAVVIDNSGAGTTFNGPVAVNASALALRGNAGAQRELQFQTGSTLRWKVFADSGAESGSNAGSDFYIQGWSDAGAYLSNPFVIRRSTGRVIMGTGVDVGGTLSINRTSGEGQLWVGQNDGYFYANAAQAGWYSGTVGSWTYSFAQRNILVGTNPVWHAGNLANPAYSTTSNAVIFDWGTHSAGNLGLTIDGTYQGAIWHSGKLPNPAQTTGFTMTGQMVAAEGTVAVPGITFANDGAPDTGFFHISDGVFGITNNAKETARFISAGTNRMLLGTTVDDGSSVLQVNGTISQTAQVLKVNRTGGEGQLWVGQNDGYFYANAASAGWYSGTMGAIQYFSSDRSFQVNGSRVWTDASAPVSRKNRIINGECTVAQRGALVLSAGVSGYGGPDRFFTTNAASAGGQFTQSQGTITYGGVARSAVVQTVNTPVANLSGGNFWNGISQRIEGYNCADLLGQPVVISFIFSTNVSGTYSVALVDGGVTNTCVSSFSAVAGTPVKVVVPMPTLPTSLSIPNSNAIGLFLAIGGLNQGTSQTSTLNAWQAGNFVSAAGAVNWGAAANNFIALTELQLEPGSLQTVFERRLFPQVLADCMRYYQTAAATVTPTRADFYSPLALRETMRVAPTLVWYSSANGAVGYVHDNDRNVDVPVAGSLPGTDFIGVVTNGSSQMSVGANTTLAYRASAEL